MRLDGTDGTADVLLPLEDDDKNGDHHHSGDSASNIGPAPRHALVALAVLTLVSILNQIDRAVLAVVIPADLQCDDGDSGDAAPRNHTTADSDCISFSSLEQGLLTGPAFTATHVVTSLPLAYAADRPGVSRKALLAGCLFVWTLVMAR